MGWNGSELKLPKWKKNVVKLNVLRGSFKSPFFCARTRNLLAPAKTGSSSARWKPPSCSHFAKLKCSSNRLPSRAIRVRKSADVRYVTRAVRIAFLEVNTQFKLGETFPVLRLGYEPATFGGIVSSPLAAQRTHCAQAPNFVHCNLPAPLIHNLISFFVRVETTFMPQTFLLLMLLRLDRVAFEISAMLFDFVSLRVFLCSGTV